MQLFGFTKKDIARIKRLLQWFERQRSKPTLTRRRRPTGGGIPKMLIAEVDSDATGGGYYNCHLQRLDATDWNSTTADQLDDTGDSVVVLNLAEIGTSIHNLDAGDLIMCWKVSDDEGNIRLAGNEVFGRQTGGKW